MTGASSAATPTTITIVTATPEHMSASSARTDPQPVAAVDRAVVVDEQEVHEPEHQRARERDLERPQHVLRAGAEQHEHRSDDRGGPRAHAGPPHDDPQQRRGARGAAPIATPTYGR